MHLPGQNPITLRRYLFQSLVFLAGTIFATTTQAQTGNPSTWQAAGVADWDSGANWSTGNLPDGQFSQYALIDNGGTAFVDSPILTLPGAIEIADGTLEIRSGTLFGMAGVTPLDRRLVVSGTSTLDVRTGGNIANIAAASIGVGSTFKVLGPSPSFSAESLTLSGSFAPEITDLTHTPLNISGATTLGGALDVTFSGLTPPIGSTWDLINAGSIGGSFATVTANGLGAGLELSLQEVAGGNGELLRLEVVATAPIPDIAVQVSGSPVSDGVVIDTFEPLGESVIIPIVIQNDGNAELNGLALTISGSNPGDFTADPLGDTALMPTESTAFNVTFRARGSGTRSATIQIASNDPDENPFQITINIAPSDSFRTWAGPVGFPFLPGDWAVGSHWTGGILPTSTAAALIDNGGEAQVDSSLALTPPGTVIVENGKLKIGPSGELPLVAGSPRLLVLANGTLILVSGGVVSGVSDAVLHGVYHPLVTAVPFVPVSTPGTASLDGVLRVEFAGASQSVGSTWDLLDAGAVEGAFATIEVLGLNPGLNFIVHQVSGGVNGTVVRIQLTAEPELTVEEQPSASNLDSGDLVAFPVTSFGDTSVKSLTVRNDGFNTLDNLTVSLEGDSTDVFTAVPALPATLTPGQSATLNLTYSPLSYGLRNTILRITSNDLDENPFELILSGKSPTPFRTWLGLFGNDWTSSLAWSENQLPNGNEAAVIDNGDSVAVSTSLAGTRPGALIIRNGAVLVYSAGELVIDGFIIASTEADGRFEVGSAGALTIFNGGEFFAPFAANFAASSQFTVEGPAATFSAQTLNLSGDFQPVLTSASFEPLSVSGNTDLGGTLQVDFSGITPIAGDAWTLIDTGSVTGSFASISATGLGTGLELFVATPSGGANGTLVRLQVIVEGAGPEIAVEQPAGNPLAIGDGATFPGTAVGGSNVLTFTVRNEGTLDLTGLAVTKSGTNADEFTVGALGATSLPPGQTTTFAVTFSPSATGTRSTAIQIASNDADENPFDLNLSGSGLTPEIAVEQPAGAGISDGSLQDFGSTVVGGSAPLTFTIRNLGSADLTGLAVTKDGTDAALYTVGALGATVLAPGETTTFTVIFAPTSLGAKAAAIHIASNDADENPFDIDLTGTGIAPEIAVEQPAGAGISDGSLQDFGSTVVGGSAPLTFTIRNLGSADLTGLAVTKDGADAALYTVGALGATVLAPGETTTFTVIFAPTSLGAKAAAIHIASNDADENPFDIDLTGTGIAPEIAVEQPAGAGISDGSLQDFGSTVVGGSAPLTFTIRNLGSADLTGLAVTKDGTDAALYTVGALGATVLAPGETTTFTVIFAPTSLGAKAAAIHIASNDADENPFDIDLTGTGIAPEIAVEQPAGAGISDGSLQDFGSTVVGGSAPLTFTIRNLGSADLTGLAVTKDGTDAALYTVGALGATVLAPGETTTFTVIFAPTSLGAKAAAIHIASNDADENPFDIDLTGTGIAPEIAVEQPAGAGISDGSLQDFGSTVVGGSAPLTFTIRNLGSADLTGLAVTKDGADAALYTVGALGATVLAPGETTTFTVIFAPTSLGAKAAAIHIASNDADENPFDIDLTGTGIAPEIAVEQPAGAGISDGSLQDFGSTVVGGSAPLTFTIRNLGSADLTGLAVTKDGTDAALYTVGALGATVLAPGETTTFTVIFAPTSLGAKAAAIHIASNDADENPFDIALTGTGVVPDIVVERPVFNQLVDGATVDISSANVGGSANGISFTIRNTGSGTLSGLVITSDGPHADDFTVDDPVSTTVAPGSTTTFTLNFSPSAPGVRTFNLYIASNDPDENPFDLTVTGTGLAPEIVVEEPVGTDLVDGGSLAFGDVETGSSLMKTVTVRNDGTSNLSIYSVSVTGTHASEFVAGSPGSSVLTPGQTTTFDLTFTPGDPGPRTAALRINSNDGDEALFDLALSGTGVITGLVVESPPGTPLTSGSTAPLGNVLVGQSETLTLILRNPGSSPLTGITASKSGFFFTGFTLGTPGTTSLASGESTTLNLTFAPTGTGGKSTTLTIDTAQTDPFTLVVTATGLADTDGDQASNAWENANGFDPNVAGDIDTLDTDGDGDLDIMEIYQGTSRTDPTQHHGLLNPSYSGPGILTVRYRRDLTQSAVVGTPRWSPDLLAWHGSGESVEGVTVDLSSAPVETVPGPPSAEISEMTATVSSGTSDKLFLTIELKPNE